MPFTAPTSTTSTTTYDALLLRAGAFRLDGGAMFGLVPKVLWEKLAPPDASNRIPLQTNCLLLRDSERTVLVETGFGDKWSEKEREIFALERRTVVDALREVGVAAEEITHVIPTHLHFDHAAALTSGGPHGADGVAGELRPTFPNAEIIVQRTEWEDALANKSTMSKTYLRTHLNPVAERVRCVHGELEVLPGIVVEPMPGHTWGQQAVRFDDGGGIVCFPADVMPTANHSGSAFNMAYDMLPYQNMLSKRALLERAEGEGWRLVLDHEPGHAVYSVVTEDARQVLRRSELSRGRDKGTEGQRDKGKSDRA